jgi:hypothetical protein
MTQWHKGPPPSIGWWPASVQKDADSLRWWDGQRWSASAGRASPVWNVHIAANTPCLTPASIEWTERPEWWPARSKT